MEQWENRTEASCEKFTFNKDKGFQVRCDTTIPSGAQTCHFTIWKSPMTAYLGDYDRMERKLKRISKKSNCIVQDRA
ncbi:MAG: hypothetical protein M1491_05275 [Deltaproteobacteria bacterium]|nr:hypothetical protein [Deltaproteobacteria bacterium]MCL5278092.1 hypothetical protein [Deltaproteobacteria bacterium]